MSEKAEVVLADVPATGPGSLPGMRYFVSSKFPHLVVTIEPAQDKTDTQRAVPGQYARLNAIAKPNEHRGDGELGTENHSGTDRNDNPYMGLFEVYDPGPEPEEGFSDDPEKDADGKRIPRANRRTAKQKALLRKTVEVLRETDHYKKTQQDNLLKRVDFLVELTWDPTPLSGTLHEFVRHGSKALGSDEAKAPAPPVEKKLEAPRPKVPNLARK